VVWVLGVILIGICQVVKCDVVLVVGVEYVVDCGVDVGLVFGIFGVLVVDVVVDVVGGVVFGSFFDVLWFGGCYICVGVIGGVYVVVDGVWD